MMKRPRASSICRRLYHLLTLITVEPVMFLHTLMAHTTLVVRSNLFMDKACRVDFNYTMEICHNLTRSGHADHEIKKMVESRVAELDLYDGIITALPSVAFCLFVGSWSDHHGRKPLLIIPVIGSILSCVVLALNYYFFYELSSWYLLLASVGSLFGGPCFGIGLFGYISDVTTTKGRTARMSVLSGVFSLAYVIGVTIGGRLYKALDDDLAYYVIFGQACGLGVICIIYTVFFVKESVQVSREEAKLHKFLDFDNVKECLHTAFRRRPNKGRMCVIILILNFCAITFCFNSAKYDYLLAQLKFDWTIVEYSDYLSVQRVCRCLALFLLLPLLSRVLKLRDSLVAGCSLLFSVTAYLLMAFSENTWRGPDGSWPEGWIMYLSATLQMESLIAVVVRSQCTKTVGGEEAGRILSVVALAQALVPLVASPLYGFMYRATIDSFPGAYLVVMDCLLLLSFLGSVVLYCHDRKRDV